LVDGSVMPRTALTAALACAAFGALAVIWFAAAGQSAPAAIGTAMGLLAWSYSAPPLRLACRGWGELDTALVVAVLVPLAGYAVFTGCVDELALAATLAPAFAMFAMMIAVEWPDREADAAGDKRNLLVRRGPAVARLAAVGALLIVPALCVPIGRGAPWAGALFAALLVPPCLGFARSLWSPQTAPPTELAARGVTVFLLTTVYDVLGYLTALR
jgi:1,4-dihydroxy-2-naphthoate octaprenyltransferase